MSDLFETELRAALTSRAEGVSTVVETRLCAIDYHPRAHRVPLVPTVSAGCALVAGIVCAIVLLSSGTPAAFVGWTPVPRPAVAAEVASARNSCGQVPAGQVLATEVRGPFTTIVYSKAGRLWQCISRQQKSLWDASTQYPVRVYATPPNGKITEPLIYGHTYGAAAKQLKTLRREELRIAKHRPSPTRTRELRGLTSMMVAALNGPDSLHAVTGTVGRGVTDVTFLLHDGTRVRATVEHGWYLAWWPGTATAEGANVVDVIVKTSTGSSVIPLVSGRRKSAMGTGPFVTLTLVSGVSPTLTSNFDLFRKIPPAEPSQEPVVVRRSMNTFKLGILGMLKYRLGLDPSEIRGVSLGASRSVWVIPGSGGICVRSFEVLKGAAGGGGTCATVSGALRSGVMDMVYSEGGTNGERQWTIAGIVPNGNRMITVHLRTGRNVSVPVKDNALLANFSIQPAAVTLRSANGSLLTHRT